MEALFLYEIVRVAVGAGILVSIVVSIPACHAGDPGSIPGRGDLFAICIFLTAISCVSFSRHFLQLPSRHRPSLGH